MTNLIFLDTPVDQIKIQLTDKLKKETWQQINSLSNEVACYRGYVNLLARKVFISWLNLMLENNFIDTVKIEDNLSIWEFINGNAIDIDNSRIVLIPVETQDKTDFSIAEEWLKIPQWVGNYYVFMEVNLEENYLNFIGYTSYQSINNHGELDSFNHCVDFLYEYLETDINLICLEYEYEWNLIPQILPLPLISSRIKETLFKEIQDNISSRLFVNFDHWLSFISDSENRYQLFSRGKYLNLSDWLKGKFLDTLNKGWQSLDILNKEYINFNSSFDPVLSSRSFSLSDSLKILQENIDKNKVNNILGNINNLEIEPKLRIELITVLESLIEQKDDEETRWNAVIALQKLDSNHPSCAIWQGKILNLDSQNLGLLMGILPKNKNTIDIFVRIYAINNNDYLPENLQLQILDQNNNIFAKIIADNQSNIIQYKFWGNFQETFSLKVILNDHYIEENFNI